MSRRHLALTLPIACMLLMSSGIAGADILQCADAQGGITYTNMPCQNGANLVSPHPATSNIKLAPAAPTFSAVGDTHESAWARKTASKRHAGPDVTTLQAARTAMQIKDQMSSLSHHPKLAALDQDGPLDQRGPRWFNF